LPLALLLPVTRRVAGLSSRFAPPPVRATLSILVVIARPLGPRDVGHRTISWPLLDAIRHSRQPTTIDLVRPGSWYALREHLRGQIERYGLGWYQVIHFDLIGGFKEFTALLQGQNQGQLGFDSALVQPFEGRRPFLFFETAVEGKAAPVFADAVAS